MILRNATKDPKELNVKTKTGGVISIRFNGGEEKTVADDVIKLLKTNQANAHWFRTGIIVEVKAPKAAAPKAEVKEKNTPVPNPKKAKGKKGKNKKSKFDTDLGL